MKVYILKQDKWDRAFVGAFSTEDKARAYADRVKCALIPVIRWRRTKGVLVGVGILDGTDEHDGYGPVKDYWFIVEQALDEPCHWAVPNTPTESDHVDR